jgi:hypothetical protein
MSSAFRTHTGRPPLRQRLEKRVDTKDGSVWRKRVAQIFGKPIYVVTDVALLPFSSQSEAEKAVVAAVHQHDATADTEDDSSDAESMADDPHDVQSAADVQKTPSPTDDVRSKPDKDGTTAATNIAEDVFSRRGLQLSRPGVRHSVCKREQYPRRDAREVRRSRGTGKELKYG